MKYFLFLLLTLSSFVFAEKKVELVSIYATDVEFLTQILHKKNFSARVVKSDLSHYNLKKDRTRWGKLLRKIYSPKVAVGDDVVKIIFSNINVHYRRDLDLSRLPKEKMVLFMWEPPTTLRKMYSKRLKNWFSRIYTWDDDLVDNKTYFKFYYPVLRAMIPNIPSFEEKKLCTLVSSNNRGKYPNELYKERRNAIDFFEKIGEKGFEFYGRGWEKTEHPSYQGAISDKINTIKNYRFSICYENSQDLKGYITEKIFDCFAAGNIPIYWGASNIETYIPKDCFIDRREFESLDKLYRFIKNMGQEEYEGYLERIRNYLDSDQAKLFSQENYENIFYESVEK